MSEPHARGRHRAAIAPGATDPPTVPLPAVPGLVDSDVAADRVRPRPGRRRLDGVDAARPSPSPGWRRRTCCRCSPPTGPRRSPERWRRAGVGTVRGARRGRHRAGHRWPAAARRRAGHAAAAAGLLVRGLLVTLVGLALVELESSVAVILAYYGLLFALATPLLRLRAPTLAGAAGVVRARPGAQPPAASRTGSRSRRPTRLRRAGRSRAVARHADPDRLLPGAAVADLPAGRDGGRPAGPAVDPGCGGAARRGSQGSRSRPWRARRCCSGPGVARACWERSCRVGATAPCRATRGGGSRWRRRTPARRSTSRTPRAPRSGCWARRCCWPGRRRRWSGRWRRSGRSR